MSIIKIDPNLNKQIPKFVTPHQMRLAFNQLGVLNQVESLIASSDEASKITWEYAVRFEYNHPLIVDLGTKLKLSQDEIDDLFIMASKL